MKFLFNLPLSKFQQRIIVPITILGKLVKHHNHLLRTTAAAAGITRGAEADFFTGKSNNLHIVSGSKLIAEHF